MKLKTFSQMNAERAAGRARYPKGVNWFKKKMDRDLKAASSQARKRVGPPIKNQAASRLTVYKL